MTEQKRLGDIATYINGFAFKPEDRGTVGLPIIRIQDLTGNAYDLGFYDGNYPKRIEINNGDVLISWSASLGVYIWNRGKALLNQHIFKVVFDKCEVNKEYFVYAVRHKLKEMESKTHGATMKHIVKKDFDNTLIPFPTLNEQREIAELLDTAATILLARQQQLQKLDELVKARFVEMFVYKSWNTVCAGSIMTNMRNGVSPSNTGSYPAKVLTLSAITQGSFNPASWKSGMFDSAPPSDKRVTALDFYMCRGNGNKNLVGAGVYSKEDISDLVFPDTVIAATVDSQKVCLAYLFYAWKQPSVREQIEHSARTTNGTYKINQKVVSNIKLILPPMELQKQFAAFVEQIDRSKVAIQKALDDAQLLFDSLMQQYFS